MRTSQVSAKQHASVPISEIRKLLRTFSTITLKNGIVEWNEDSIGDLLALRKWEADGPSHFAVQPY